jgi:hypothetical protein
MATLPQKSRQTRALDMLKAQLESGVKTKKKTTDEKVPLTDSDKKRIKSEIEILTKRI